MIPIAHHKTRHGEIVVLGNRTSVAYWQDERHQSHADKSGVSLAGYIHAIHSLVRQANCRDVLMIGCGGGTLATMLHAGGTKVTIVERNARSFAISRKHFCLPNDVTCHVGDGRAFLENYSRRFDAIVLDAYDGDDIPQTLRTADFFELVKSRLRPKNGCFFANVIIRNGRDRRVQDLLLMMQASWPAVRLLAAPGASRRNAIAMAGAVSQLERPNLVLRPATGAKRLARQLAALAFVTAPRADTRKKGGSSVNRPFTTPDRRGEFAIVPIRNETACIRFI